MLSKLDFEKLKEKTKKEILHYLKEKNNAILFEIQNKIINYIFKNLTEHDNLKNNKLKNSYVIPFFDKLFLMSQWFFNSGKGIMTFIRFYAKGF